MGRLFKEMLIIGLAGLAGLYLLNPTFGLFEFIPDAMPIIGNLDEVGATLIILNAFRYYGVDLQRLFGRQAENPTDSRASQPARLPDGHR
jgi:hypothetical protein